MKRRQEHLTQRAHSRLGLRPNRGRVLRMEVPNSRARWDVLQTSSCPRGSSLLLPRQVEQHQPRQLLHRQIRRGVAMKHTSIIRDLRAQLSNIFLVRQAFFCVCKRISAMASWSPLFSSSGAMSDQVWKAAWKIWGMTLWQSMPPVMAPQHGPVVCQSSKQGCFTC